MKRLVLLAVILSLAGAGLYFAQRRQTQDTVSSNAVVDVAADLQRDATRLLMHTPVSLMLTKSASVTN
jgi:hypothetical protein